MRYFCNLIFILFFICQHKVQADQVAAISKCLKFKKIVTEETKLEDIYDQLWAVHATNIPLKKDGTILAGLEGTEKAAKKGPPVLFRPTTHFSIGELVRAHDAGSWDDNSMAIVTPLKSLQDQMVILNPYDTFIVGDLKLDPNTVIVVSNKYKGSFPDHLEVTYFDPDKTNLREAVDAAIEKKQGLKVTMKDTVDAFAEAEINGVNINKFEFFEDFLQKNNISWGGHVNSRYGWAGRLGMIDVTIQNLVRNIQSSSSTLTSDIYFDRQLIIYHLDFVEKQILASKNTKMIKSFGEKKQHLIEFLKYVDLELSLNKSGLTLSAVDTEFIKKNMLNFKEIDRYVQRLKANNQLVAKPHIFLYGISFDRMAIRLSYIKPEERLSFVKSLQGEIPQINQKELWVRVKMYDMLKEDPALFNQNFDQFLVLFDKLDKNKKDSILIGIHNYLLSREVDPNKFAEHPFVKILNHPDMQGKFSFFGYDGVDKIESYEDFVVLGNRYLQVLQSDPYKDIRGGYFTANDMFKYFGDWVKNKSFELKIPQTVQEKTDFEYSVTRLDYARKNLLEEIRLLENVKLSESRSIDDILPGEQLYILDVLKMEYRDELTLEGVFKSLGVLPQFRKKYPKEEDFWKEDKTFLEVFLELQKMTK